MRNKILVTIGILLGLFCASSVVAFFFTIGDDTLGYGGGNVAVIPVKGYIAVEDSSGLFGGQVASSDELVAEIDKAASNPEVKAILFDINSGGGSPVATDEISRKIKSVNKTTVAVIREIGASGAYWIATSADYVFANRMSITGSIGVIGSYLSYYGLMERYNVTYERMVAGDLKDIGTPYKEMTPDERARLQDILDKMHRIFIQEVATNRNLSYSEVEKLATGMVYLGEDAKDLHLVDELGNKDDALKYIEGRLNITAVPVEYTKKQSILDVLSQMAAEQSASLKIAKYLNPAATDTGIRV